MPLELYDPLSTSIKGAIHAMWAEDATLMALHDASRFYTGRVPASRPGTSNIPPTPYTRLATPGGSRGTRTSSTEYPLEMVEFHVWTDGADEGDAIASAIRDCYADRTWQYESGVVVDTRYDGTNQKQITKPNYTAWETVVKFTLRLMRQRVN